MHSPIYIQPPTEPTKTCDRCGLHFSIDEKECTHCKDLSDKQVMLLKIKIRKQQKGNANLGRLFMYISVLLAVLMIALASA